MFSFEKRKRLVEVGNLIRQVVDLTAPNLPPREGESRSENRSNRSLPALLAPWEDGQPMVDETGYALTKDCSDRGLALVLQQPFKAEQVVIGLWLESPRFCLAEVRQNVPLGGGFWQLGLELTEVVDPADHPELEALLPLASRLTPRAKVPVL